MLPEALSGVCAETLLNVGNIVIPQMKTALKQMFISRPCAFTSYKLMCKNTSETSVNEYCNSNTCFMAVLSAFMIN